MIKKENYIYSIYTGSKLRNKSYVEEKNIYKTLETKKTKYTT
jgi:hypothetical protein